MKKIIWPIVAFILGIGLTLSIVFWKPISTFFVNAWNWITNNQTQTTTALTTDTYYKLGEYTLIDLDGREVLEYELNITEDKLDYLNKGYEMHFYDAEKNEFGYVNMTYLSSADLFGEDSNLKGHGYDLSEGGYLFYNVEFVEETGEFLESDKVKLWFIAEAIGGAENAEMFNGFEIKEIVEEDPLPSPAPDTEE